MKRVCIIFLFSLNACIAYTVKSKIFYAPKNCSYSSAHIRIENFPSEVRGSDMGPRRIAARSVHSLVILRDKQESVYLLGVSNVSSSDYQIHFSEDCKNLTFSDNKKDFRGVSLETNPPLFCRHNNYGNKSDFPSIKNFVFEILESQYDIKTSNGHAKNANLSKEYEFFKEELGIALRYATLNADDPDLRKSLAKFISKPGYQLNIHEDFIFKEFPKLMEKYSDFKETIQSATMQKESEFAWKLTSAFQENENPEIELSSTLSQNKSFENCIKVYNLTKAIAYRTAKTNKWFPKTVNILSRVIDDPLCPLKEKPEHYSEYKEIWSMKGEAARVIAIKTLALISSKDSAFLLKKHAAKSCGGYRRDHDKLVRTSGPLPLFVSKGDLAPNVIDFANIDTHTLHDISCWAKEYLACCK